MRRGGRGQPEEGAAGAAGARLLEAIAGTAARRAGLVVALALVLAAAGVVAALQLRPSSATDTLVNRSSATYQATQRFYRAFGSESIVVQIRGSLSSWLFGPDLERELGLEGCLSGNLTTSDLATAGGPDGPCGQLARSKPVKVVLGPGTFVNESVIQIDNELSGEIGAAERQAGAAYEDVYRAALARSLGAAQARRLGDEARELIDSQFEQQLLQSSSRYGLTSVPALNNEQFVSRLVCTNGALPCSPKPRFAYLFPNGDTAIITVRLKSGLSQSAQNDAISLVRAAVSMPQWRPTEGETYSVTGEPVIVSDLTGSITSSLKLLLVAALIVMAGVLALVFGRRPRLLPLVLALLAAAITFGLLAATGAPLTMASIAVLPVLIGLAVDYGIQFQSRVAEAMAAGGPGGSVADAVRSAARRGAPTLVVAATATAGGFLVLLLSPVPMVRGFAALLVVGIAVSLACTLTVGSAAMVLWGRLGSGPSTTWAARPAGLLGDAVERLGAAGRGARELVLDNAGARRVRAVAWAQATQRPGRLLAIGLLLAAIGWGVETQTAVQTDITKLVPQNLASLRNLDSLERNTGVGGEIDVLVSSPDLLRPAVVDWMSAFQTRVLDHFGYSETTPGHGCGAVQLCPAFSLPDLFTTGAGAATVTSTELAQVLGVVPAYLSQNVISPDHRTATLAFGIREMPLARQQDVVQTLRGMLHPPAGVQASLVGLPVLAAQANADVSSPWRRIVTLLAGLAAVTLVLVLAFRGDLRRALVPIVPIVLASGWSALVLFLIRVPLNPMSVTLEALVIAISTEFSVLLCERYRQERADGLPQLVALQRVYSRTGAAVAASGATAIAGFAVLMLSDIAMLRDFGFATVIDLGVALVGVLVALPAVLLLAERREPAGLPRRSGAAGLLARVRAPWRAGHEPV